MDIVGIGPGNGLQNRGNSFHIRGVNGPIAVE